MNALDLYHVLKSRYACAGIDRSPDRIRADVIKHSGLGLVPMPLLPDFPPTCIRCGSDNTYRFIANKPGTPIICRDCGHKNG